MKNIFQNAVFGLFFWLLQSNAALACTCAIPEFGTIWNAADAVFTGKVTTITPVEKYRKNPLDEMPVIVELDITENFKGIEKEKTFTLHTSLNEHTCTGYPFRTGESYVVFAYQRTDGTFERWSFYNFPSGTWDTGGLCGGTQDAGVAHDTLDLLRARKEAPKETLIDKLMPRPAEPGDDSAKD